MQKSYYKQGKVFKLLVVLVVLVAFTMSMISSTLTKYITTVDGDGTITGAMFNFNDNGTTHEWNYDFLGATVDSSDDARDDDGFKTLDGGRMLAPGQSGYFPLGIYFAATVDSVIDVEDTVLSGTGAFAGVTPLDTVPLKFIVSMSEITNPDFNSAAAVNASGFEAALEYAMTESIGAGGYYRATDPVTVIDKTVHVYWEWLENVDDAADTAMGLNIYNAAVVAGSAEAPDYTASQLELHVEATIQQVELDGVNYTEVPAGTVLDAGAQSLRLTGNVTLDTPYVSSTLLNLDLGGHTLTCPSFQVTNNNTNITVNIYNGSIVTSAGTVDYPDYSIYVSVPNGTVNYTNVINTVADGKAAYANGSLNTINLFGTTKFIFANGNTAPMVIPADTRVVVTATQNIAIQVASGASNVLIENKGVIDSIAATDSAVIIENKGTIADITAGNNVEITNKVGGNITAVTGTSGTVIKSEPASTIGSTVNSETGEPIVVTPVDAVVDEGSEDTYTIPADAIVLDPANYTQAKAIALYAKIDSVPEGSTIVFKPGTYYVSTVLSIEKNLTLVGLGDGNDVIIAKSFAAGSNRHCINCTYRNTGAAADRKTVIIRNLTVDGGNRYIQMHPAEAIKSQAGIQAIGNIRVDLYDVTIIQCTLAAISINAANTVSNSLPSPQNNLYTDYDGAYVYAYNVKTHDNVAAVSMFALPRDLSKGTAEVISSANNAKSNAYLYYDAASSFAEDVKFTCDSSNLGLGNCLVNGVAINPAP